MTDFEFPRKQSYIPHIVW